MTKPTTKPPARKRVDWEAIERDYRTGQFSLRELEKKHGAGFSKIGKRAKDEAWSKDLADAVRQATSAALIAEVATERATEGLQGTTDVVLAAAEVNKRVILGHRQQAANSRAAMETALAKVLSLADNVADIREAGALAAAVESLSRTSKLVIEIERKAFDIDTAEPGAGGKPRSVASKTIYELTDDELVADIMARRAQAQGADA